MKKKFAAFFTALALMLTGCSSESADEEIKIPIYGGDGISFEIAAAQYMDLSETKTIGATLGYPYAVYVTYPADAQVTFFDVTNNADVVEGQILAELDSSNLDYEINNQQTIVNAAYTASLSGGTAEQLQYEIEREKLEMLLAEKDSYTIRAPFDGVITSVNHIAEGTDVSEGGVVCTISEKDKAAVYIEGGEAADFRFGQQVQIKIDGTAYDATVVEAPDIAPETSKNNRAVFMLNDNAMETISNENPMAITAGWATVYVTEECKNVLAVPDEAIKTLGTDTYVTIVDGEERYKLYVTIGKQLGGYTQIINGISEGDIVMAQGSGVFSSSDDNSTDDRQGGFGDFGNWDGEAPPEQ